MSDSSSIASEDSGEWSEQPVVLFETTALVDYGGGAEGAGGLRFTAGDAIGVTSFDDELWWYGCIMHAPGVPAGPIGEFPLNFADGDPLITWDDEPEEEREPEAKLQPEPEPEPEPEPGPDDDDDDDAAPPGLGLLKEGILGKRGGSETVADGARTKRFWATSGWKARHFVLLENGWLKYWATRYDAMSDKEPKGELLLDPAAEFTRLPEDSRGELAFTVFGATTSLPGGARREITVRCASDEDLEHWLLCLDSAIQRAPPPARATTVTSEVPHGNSEQDSADMAELAKQRARQRARERAGGSGGAGSSAALLTHERSFPPVRCNTDASHSCGYFLQNLAHRWQTGRRG